jgi:hypothetical protein
VGDDRWSDITRSGSRRLGENAMKDNRSIVGFSILSIGVGVNILDAYFSGNLPFSPQQSDQNNKLSVLNRMGRDMGAPGMSLGTMLALVGGLILVTSWIVGSRK